MRLRTPLPRPGRVSRRVVVTGCAAPDDGEASGADTEPTGDVQTLEKDDAIAAKLPDEIANAGVVRVASGISFPPMEYFDTDNKTVLGFDADLGKALGEVLGVDFEFHNTNFDGIIGGLKAGRYDLGLTSMIDKKERQVDVDFVDYLKLRRRLHDGQGQPRWPDRQADLCGKTVAVEKSATGDLVADEHQRPVHRRTASRRSTRPRSPTRPVRSRP